MSTIMTIPVQMALETQRQELALKLDARAIVAEVLDNVGCRDVSNPEGLTAAINDLDQHLTIARACGALDQVCAEHGITEAAMARIA